MKAQTVQESNTDDLLKRNNICGTAIGEKWVDGKPTGQEAVLIFVEKKLTRTRLLRKFSEDIIPSEIDGIPTDIIEVGKITKQSFRSVSRPLQPGFSCGHINITAGTIGGFFIDRDGDPVILSNNHVLANENAAKFGDSIVQPGPMDRRNNQETVATLKNFLKMKKDGSNEHDSAIAKISEQFVNGNLVDPIYPTINKRLLGFGEASINMPVQKCGRTTGYTTGKVLGLNATFTVEYDFGPAKFEKCIVATAMSNGGDSGSLIMDMSMNAVGLLFAGSPKVTIANPINLVKNYYGLELWGSPVDKIKIGDKNWRMFSTDGRIEVTDGLVNFIDNANHHCFIERALTGRITSVSCKINTGTDAGSTWGPGLVLVFPTGMLKVNLRHNSTFGGYFNTNYEVSVGKVKPNTDYILRIRRDTNSWNCEVKDGNDWFTAMAIPSSIFPMEPTAVRIGKTGVLGSTRDHSPPNTPDEGPMGFCTASDFEIT